MNRILRVGGLCIFLAPMAWSLEGKTEYGKYVRGDSGMVTFRLDRVADDTVPFPFDPALPFAFGLGRSWSMTDHGGIYIEEQGGVQTCRSRWVYRKLKPGDKKHPGATEYPGAEMWQDSLRERGTLSDAQKLAIARALADSRIGAFHLAYFPSFDEIHSGWVFQIRQGGRTKTVSLADHYPKDAQDLVVAVDSILAKIHLKSTTTTPEANGVADLSSYIRPRQFKCRKVVPDSALLE